MVMSVTPTVCITLAFWLGRSGLICSGGCCANAYGAAQIDMSPIAKVKSESRFREIMLVLLVKEFAALCNAAWRNRKERRKSQGCRIEFSSLRALRVHPCITRCASGFNFARALALFGLDVFTSFSQ